MLREAMRAIARAAESSGAVDTSNTASIASSASFAHHEIAGHALDSRRQTGRLRGAHQRANGETGGTNCATTSRECRVNLIRLPKLPPRPA